LIVLAVIFVLGYFTFQDKHTAAPDYHIGLVRTTPCTDQQLQTLNDTFTAAGLDVNGDGTVLVQIHTYYVNLADTAENAGVANADTVQALDADLIGNVSGIFLLEDVVTFQKITGDILEPVNPRFEQDLFFGLRKDAGSGYRDLAEKLF
jgi:hypothetical protein